MEHNTDQNNGFLSLILSAITAAMSIITVDVQVIISCIAGMVAIASGCMAIRYYFFATKKLKEGK